ncbi:kairos [Arctopsyche grandis]|uniref:kairos n=1 Tax=Arctopsyche grandis TaxID=121162 RepID=UPI00406D7899
MRRASLTPMMGLGGQEPLIVVEESGCLEEEESRTHSSSPRQSLDIESPQNPYLLSPWRDPRETRKHSLPTPACTSGITASQVRRLSERGGEGSGPSPREAAFLATLSTAPAPQPGGRRHSVVTICKVPPAMFGRNRRESVAAFSDRRGSTHNLQLDIMDDIVTARKVRMKLWNTSNERVCEVQTLDEAEGASRPPQRYTRGGRRYSDFTCGGTLPVIPSGRRRASEQPPNVPRARPLQGIVCSNTDLISILSNLTSSATEIDRCDDQPSKGNAQDSTSLESKRNKLKSSRSNSFDVSVLHGVSQFKNETNDKTVSPSSWFIKRHQTLALKKAESEKSKVIWDKPTGSVVDPQVLGSAIEVFLRQTGNNDTPPTSPPMPTSKSKSPTPGGPTKGQSSPNSWYAGKSEEDDTTETCDTSLCSTLKDLFVK